MSKIPYDVAVHPVVLLSVVDHYYRLAKQNTIRIVGVLLGEYIRNKVDVTSCFALPFEEDPKDKKFGLSITFTMDKCLKCIRK